MKIHLILRVTHAAKEFSAVSGNFILCIALFAVPFSRVSATPAPEHQSLRQMYHESWTAREGAPPNIEQALEGPDGFLWVVSDNGVYRFDGVSFEKVSLPLDHPQGIARTPDGSVWIQWFYGSSSRVKNGQITTIGPGEGLLAHQVIGVVQRGDGAYLLAGREGLQVAREISVGKFVIDRPALLAADVTMLLDDNENNIWIVADNVLEVMPHGKNEFAPVGRLASSGLYCQRDVNSGLLCAAEATTGPIARYEWRDGQVVKDDLMEANAVRGLWAPGDGSVWLGTKHGIARTWISPDRSIQNNRSESDLYTKQDGLSDEGAYSIFGDHEGSTWVLTTKGLDRFRSVPFSELDLHDPIAVALPHGKPSATTLVVTDHLIDVTAGVPVAISKQFDNGEWSRTLLRADDDTLWIGTNGGHLYHFANDQLLAQALPESIGRSSILAVTEDQSHNLWISVGANKGIFRYDGREWLRKGGQPELPDGSSPFIERDRAGGLWFGYRDDRVALLANGKIRVFGTAEGLHVGNAKAFAQNERIWVGGELGVSVLENERFYPLIIDRPGLSGVTGMAFARDGALWINGADGVIRVSKQELDINRLIGGHPAAARLFDYHDGIQGEPFPVYAESAWMDGNGKLYIANREHLQTVDPLKDRPNLRPPQVWIKGVIADGETHHFPSSALSLKPNVQAVQIDFTATSLLIPDRVAFRYQLEGYDKAWIDAGSRRQAFYSKLPPGDYVFRVMASNDSGLWNTQGVALSIIVPPTFTQTYIFEALCVVALLACAWILYKLRLIQISTRLRASMYARLSERERIARDLHDTFFQAVQGLFLTINSVMRKMAKDDPLRLVLEDTLSKSDAVMAEGRELVLYLRGRYSQGQPLATQFSDAAAELSPTSAAEFRVVVKGQAKALRADSTDELYWLGREAIANSFRHSGAQSVEVELDYGPDELRLCFRDDGTGIDQDTLQRGQRENHWGLPGMRERAKNIGAQMEIWSGRNAGTEIEIRVPATSAYAQRASAPRPGLFRTLYTRWHEKG